MPRLTADQWADARRKWEADETVSLAEIGRDFGVSKEAVSLAAERQGWVKSSTLPGINRAAQIRADLGELDGKLDPSSSKTPLPASIEESTDLRAKLIHNHRAELRLHAKLYPLDAIKESFTLGKVAKISVEMLAIRQNAERKAWGMDQMEAEKPTINIAWSGISNHNGA
jgi:hypothetical protein